jgi:hypothetical protein
MSQRASVRWGIAVGGLAIAHLVLVRPRLFRWGATDEEAERVLPGDGEVPGAQIHGTRAITIHAPPEQVWPWLAQIRYRRAGWYAFDFADNDSIPSAPAEFWAAIDRVPADYPNLAVEAFLVRNLVPVTIVNVIAVPSWSASCTGSSTSDVVDRQGRNDGRLHLRPLA